MLYMVVEHFKGGNAKPVYDRYAERGRLLPDGLEYVSSWLADDDSRCFQLMRTDDADLLDTWMAHWSDLVDFECHTVRPSAEATTVR